MRRWEIFPSQPQRPRPSNAQDLLSVHEEPASHPLTGQEGPTVHNFIWIYIKSLLKAGINPLGGESTRQEH